MKKLISPMLVLFLMITGCAKYEDGPLISFSSKEKRIEGKWEVTWAQGSEPNDTEYYEFTTTDNGGGDITITVDTISIHGSWDWVDNGDGIEMSLPDPDNYTTIVTFEFNIEKLTNDKMRWNEMDQTSNLYQIEFEKVE